MHSLFCNLNRFKLQESHSLTHSLTHFFFSGKLFVCYDTALPTIETISHSHVPICENRGPIAPVSRFKDAILDLKCIELPNGTKMLVSAGRDGEIKLFK